MRWLTVSAAVEVMTPAQISVASVTQGSTGVPTATDAPLRVIVPLLDSPEKMIGQAILTLSLGTKDDDDDDDDDDKLDVTGSIGDTKDDDKDAPSVVFVTAAFAVEQRP